MNILIYAKPEKIRHKFKGVVKSIDYCFWTGRKPAKNKFYSINFVYFSNGNEIYAKGKFLPFHTETENKIYFLPLVKCSMPQPKKPPTRGWCYIDEEKEIIK